MSSMGKQNYRNTTTSVAGSRHGPGFYVIVGSGIAIVVMAIIIGGVLAVVGVPHWGQSDTSSDLASSGNILPVPATPQEVPPPLVPETPRFEIPRATPLPVEPPAGIGAAAAAPAVESTSPEVPETEQAATAVPELDEQAQAELYAREVAFMEERFFQVKDKMMVAIDAYYQLPEDQRLNYIQQFMRQLEAETAAEREAAGLPPQPRGRNQQRLGQEFMKTFTQNATPEEKTKVNKFIGDMVQDGVRQWQREMERRANTPQP